MEMIVDCNSTYCKNSECEIRIAVYLFMLPDTPESGHIVYKTRMNLMAPPRRRPLARVRGTFQICKDESKGQEKVERVT